MEPISEGPYIQDGPRHEGIPRDGRFIAFPDVQCDFQPPHQRRKCDAGTTDACARSRAGRPRKPIHPGRPAVREEIEHAGEGKMALDRPSKPLRSACRRRGAQASSRNGPPRAPPARPSAVRRAMSPRAPAARRPRRAGHERPSGRSSASPGRPCPARHWPSRRAPARAEGAHGRKAGAVSPDAAELDS